MPHPVEEMWKKIANGYHEMWNFLNSIVALFGTHMVFETPLRSGSLFFYYEKTFLVDLLALVDAHCNFIAVDLAALVKAKMEEFLQNLSSENHYMKEQ